MVVRRVSRQTRLRAIPTAVRSKPRSMRDNPARTFTLALGMSTPLPALGDFRRIVVKVGSSLLVDRVGGRRHDAWLAVLADDLACLHGEARDVLGAPAS